MLDPRAPSAMLVNCTMLFGVSTLSLTHLSLHSTIESVDLTALAPSLTAVDLSGIASSSCSKDDPTMTLSPSHPFVCAAANNMSGKLDPLGTLLALRYLDCSGNQCMQPPLAFEC